LTKNWGKRGPTDIHRNILPHHSVASITAQAERLNLYNPKQSSNNQNKSSLSFNSNSPGKKEGAKVSSMLQMLMNSPRQPPSSIQEIQSDGEDQTGEIVEWSHNTSAEVISGTWTFQMPDSRFYIWIAKPAVVKPTFQCDLLEGGTKVQLRMVTNPTLPQIQRKAETIQVPAYFIQPTVKETEWKAVFIPPEPLMDGLKVHYNDDDCVLLSWATKASNVIKF